MLKFYFLWAELLCLAASIVFAARLKGSVFIWFIPFLILTNIQEWGSRYGYMSIAGSNAVSLNLFTTIEFIFYGWLFYNEAQSNARRKKIVYLAIAMITGVVINMLFFQSPLKFHSYSYLLGSIIIIIFCLWFFKDLMSGERFVELLSYRMFWVSSGLLFFYMGMFVCFTLFEVLSTQILTNYFIIFNILMNVFNIILYTCFTISFLCRPKQTIITS
jgi:hypothetical protein